MIISIFLKNDLIFLLAGEFSQFGQSMGYGEEYKTREIDVDPLLTQGDGVELLYDNDYDEFSPISQELEKKLHKMEGIDWENSNLIEGAYVTTVMSRKGIRLMTKGFRILQMIIWWKESPGILYKL